MFWMVNLNLNQVHGKHIQIMNIGLKKSDWVHGSDADTDLGDLYYDLIVIRVVESGKDHAVFIE